MTVTDVAGEAPGKPDAPTVAPASVSSLTVTWSVPSNAGPAITDYDVQYRAGTTGDWTDGNHVGTATTATLSSLSENTSYQVQVRATNDEGTGDWSDSGNRHDGRQCGTVVLLFGDVRRGGEPDDGRHGAGDRRRHGRRHHRLPRITGGADQAFFSIGATSGALTFDAAPNFEDAQDSDTGNDYVVEVQATSGAREREKTATQTITVTVTGRGWRGAGQAKRADGGAGVGVEPNGELVGAVERGPGDHRLRRAGTGRAPAGAGATGATPRAATTATLSSLSENTSYQVQVRARNDEGTGDWSDSGTGTTDANAAPSFSSSATFDGGGEPDDGRHGAGDGLRFGRRRHRLRDHPAARTRTSSLSGRRRGR